MTPPLLDTSYVVRYLTDDPPDLGARAAAVIDAGGPLGITAVAIAEAAHVLRSFYGFSREAVVDALLALVQKDAIEPVGVERALLLQALLLCRPSGRVSVPDALLWAEARSTGANAVYTFDRQFPAAGIQIR